MKTLKNVLAFFVFSITLGVAAQNTAFNVSVSGKGEPLLFFPGFTCTGEVWEDSVSELSKYYECHVFTFAGFGEVAPIEKPWLPKIKEAIEVYVSTKALKDPVIIGHSLGGTLGLWLASEENHPYKKIIVVDALPSTGALMMPDFKSEYIVYDNPYNKQLLEMDLVSFEKMSEQMAMGMTLNTEGQKKVKEWMLLADRETYVYGYTDLLKLDLREDIAKISIPVTILAATQPYGKETVRTTYEGQYQKLPNYSIKFADESAHFIMYDQPEWFITNVKEEL